MFSKPRKIYKNVVPRAGGYLVVVVVVVVLVVVVLVVIVVVVVEVVVVVVVKSYMPRLECYCYIIKIYSLQYFSK